MNAVPQPVKRAVPLLDLKPQYLAIKADVDAAIARVCASQMFILGPEVEALEKAVAQYSGAQFGIGMSSGTDALLIALMAYDIGVGDEVITASYTFFATGGTVARTGARPVYLEIDPKTYNLAPAAVERFINEQCDVSGGQLVNRKTGGKVKALLPVHLYGQMADMDPLMQIARKYGLRMIEDAAQAIGSEYPHNRRAGSFGDIGCFSFFPTKNLGGFGDGGLCTANDPAVAEKLNVLRVHGGKPKYFHSLIGGNFRLDAIQAAVLNVKLKHLDAWTAGRQRNALFYDRAFAAAKLGDRVSTPVALPGYRHIYNQYCIRVPQRDKLRAYLADCGVGTEIYYPVPLHLQKCFDYLGYREGDLPESERAAKETLALPIYPELTSEQLQHVVDSIARFVHGSQ
ncbi:MAG TPA: DegT/DnrJ/EryC1/StrS family aminotransferase [Steroidobacteraceae bacterium]|nr:DegT/DnrJ/EryC1/StrS family aminotransferase [Steroidobacteraceae bacterium]